MPFKSERRLATLLVTGLIAGLVRCGGASESEPTGRVPDPPPSTDALELARAQCAYLERCDPDALHLFARSSLAACEEFFACDAGNWLLDWPRPTGALLSQCSDDLRSRDCPDFAREPLRHFGGTGVLARYGAFPWGPACGEPSIDERLAPRPDAPDLGEVCIELGQSRHACKIDGFCAPREEPAAGAHWYCGVCQPRGTPGEACTRFPYSCSDGSRCLADQCLRLLDVGEPCTQREECQLGVCESGICGLPGDREPYADLLDRACSGAYDCGGHAALQCTNGRCSPLPEEGEACSGACRDGHYCIEGKCVFLGCSQDLGEPCQVVCGRNACADGRCVPLPTEEGAPCFGNCAAGLLCSDSHCFRWGRLGEPCGGFPGCEPPLVCDGEHCADPPTIDSCR